MVVSRRGVLWGMLAASALPGPTRAQAQDGEAGFDVSVPIDHDRPSAGTFGLRCEWGAAPRADRPIVVVVADAQQYFVRAGGAARLQRELFGPSLNVLAIVGRSRSEALARLVMPEGRTDWAAAYRLLNWRQWARDVEAVVAHHAIDPARLGLYGRSGGAHLIHQLLTLRPDLGGRAYVQAAVNHPLDVRWGLSADRSWQEVAAADNALSVRLLEWLERNPDQRRNLILVLQRQHFFEPLENLTAARLAAVQAFLRGDQAAIEDARERYQIAALEQMRGTLEGVGAAVRVYEFASAHADPRTVPGELRPDTEALFYYAAPLPDPAYRPTVPPTDWTRLRQQSTEVLQVAGRHDHTCDYRTQIGLNGLTRGSTLLILDDDHVFRRWVASGTQPALLQAYFAGGLASPEFRRALEAIAPLRWRETSA
jgi:hypothetical protein